MSKEAMKLALNKAFQLGQRYWSWADSEYSSHWKKADAAKSEFDQLVQDTINAALAEQPAQQEPVAHQYSEMRDDGTWSAWLGCDKPLLANEQRRVRALYTSPPAQQEPVAVVSGYYGGQCVILPIDPARIFNSNTALYTSPPAQRTWVGLTDEERMDVLLALNWDKQLTHMDTAKAIEAKLKEKNT